MTPQTAHLIVYSITAVACVIWFAGLQFLLASAREPRVDNQFGEIEPSKRLAIQGMVEVEGEPENLSSRAASILAKGSVGQLGPVRIISRTAESVTFEGDAASMGIGKYVRQGAIHFARVGQNKTRIEYALDVPHGKALLVGGFIFQVLGLVAIAVGFLLLSTYVADARNRAVLRPVGADGAGDSPSLASVPVWDVISKPASALRGTFETFVRNLPFLEP